MPHMRVSGMCRGAHTHARTHYDHICTCTCTCTCTCVHVLHNLYYSITIMHTEPDKCMCVHAYQRELFVNSDKQCWNASTVYLHTERFG